MIPQAGTSCSSPQEPPGRALDMVGVGDHYSRATPPWHIGESACCVFVNLLVEAPQAQTADCEKTCVVRKHFALLRPCRIHPCVTPLVIAVVSCWPFVRLDCTSRFRRALPRAMPDRSRGDMRARTTSETTPTTSDAAGQMKVGYRRLCYRAYDNPAFI